MKLSKDDKIIETGKAYPTGVFEVHEVKPDGTVLASPLGGGLVHILSPHVLQKYGFRLLTEEEEIQTWRKSQFFLDTAPEQIFEGYTDGSLWNGWATPRFSFDEAIRIVKMFGFKPEEVHRVQEHAFKFPDPDEPEEYFGELIETPDRPEGIWLYPIGTRAWTWREKKD